MNNKEIISLVQTNLENYWLSLQRSSLMLGYKTDTAVYVKAPVQDAVMNSVLRFQPVPARMDEALLTLVNFHRSQKLPCCWWVSPNATAAGVMERLMALNFSQTMPVKGMAMRLSAFQWNEQLPEGIEIVEVTSPKQFSDWINVICTACYMDRKAGELYKNAMEIERQKTDNLLCYLAYYHEKPVSTFGIFFDEKVASFYNVATLSEFRHRGISSAMAAYCLTVIQQRNYEWVTLQASPHSASLFGKLGFRSYIDYLLFYG